jgi:hypothetical protein
MELKNKEQLISLLKIVGILIAVLGSIAIFPEYGLYVMFLFAICLFLSGFMAIVKYKDANSWIESVAVINTIDESSEEIVEGHVTTTYHYPEISYEYCLNKNTYRSNKVSFEKKNIWRTKEDIWGYEPLNPNWWWQDLKKGDKHQVFVNPKDITDSVLIKDLSKKRKSHHLALMISGVFLGVICMFLLRSNITSE